MRRSLPSLLAALVVVVSALPTAAAQSPAAAKTPAKTPAAARVPAVQYVKVEGVDYMFHTPAILKTGLTVFNLVNAGRDVHAMTVLALPADKTLKQFLDVFNKTGKSPAWAAMIGETGTIKPGDEAFVTARLKPGRYVLACLINAADGRSHTEVGMVQLVTAK